MPTVTIDYCPREPFMPFHDRANRWAVLVVHRRGGKTVAGLNDLIRGALTCKRAAPRFAYLAPYRQQAKLVAWDYVKHFTAPIPGRSVHESELRVDLPNDGRVTLYGADNYDALRGIYLDGAVVDEPADMAPEVWTDLLRPALSDRLGWCVWIGTPKGRNAFFRLYEKACNDPEYFTMILPASKSGILPKSELESAAKAMGKESYEREYECSFNAAIPGSIYGDIVAKLREGGRIKDYAPNKDVPFITSWDLGDSDYCVPVLWQLEGRDLNLFDYYSGTGHGPGHYADKMREWEARYGMRIRQHYLPHDAENVVRGSSWRRDLEKAGLTNIKIVPRIDYKWTGINHLRSILPRFYIHHTNCSKAHGEEGRQMPSILDCLEFYAKEEVAEGHSIKEEPKHDEFSHGCLRAGSQILTKRGAVAIENVVAGDVVVLGEGAGLVSWAGQTGEKETLTLHLSNGRELGCTPTHKVFTTEGVIRAEDCCVGVELIVESSPCISPLLKSTKGLRAAFSDYIAERGITSGQSGESTPLRWGIARGCCTTKSGWTITALCQRAMSFVQSEASGIWSGWNVGMGLADRSPRLNPCGFAGLRFTRKPTNRITGRIPGVTVMRENFFTAWSGSTTRGQSQRAGISTTGTETPPTTGLATWCSSLLQTIASFTRKPIYGWGVRRTSDSLRRRGESLVSVVAVSRQSISTPVYDLTVERHHCYFAEGVLVSNSDALRTFAEAHRAGMIDGTSFTARENRDRPVKVKRGPGPESYSKGWGGNARQGGPNVIRR